jgi:hypothetical protein
MDRRCPMPWRRASRCRGRSGYNCRAEKSLEKRNCGRFLPNAASLGQEATADVLLEQPIEVRRLDPYSLLAR